MTFLLTGAFGFVSTTSASSLVGSGGMRRGSHRRIPPSRTSYGPERDGPAFRSNPSGANALRKEGSAAKELRRSRAEGVPSECIQAKQGTAGSPPAVFVGCLLVVKEGRMVRD